MMEVYVNDMLVESKDAALRGNVHGSKELSDEA